METSLPKHRRKKTDFLPYQLVTPAFIMLMAINIWPVLAGLYQSMTNYNLLHANNIKFNGIENFAQALKDPDLYAALSVSVKWTIGAVGLCYVVGLLAALLVTKEFKGRGLYRTLLLLPWVAPPVVVSITWRWILTDMDGLLNYVLKALHLIKEPLRWLSDPKLALLSVIMVAVWRGFPFFMVTIQAAMGNIPDELYEAAQIDGANGWKAFSYITLPLILPVSVISTLLQSIWTFNDFGLLYVLTGGGPAGKTTTLSIYAYRQAFQYLHVGYGSAIAVLALVLMSVLGVVYLRLQKKYEINT
jgi:multiple sugar transport system permease protein